jgi:hypothetical protein
MQMTPWTGLLLRTCLTEWTLMLMLCVPASVVLAQELGNVLTTHQALRPNQGLRSTNKAYSAFMQSDGNFIVYREAHKASAPTVQVPATSGWGLQKKSLTGPALQVARTPVWGTGIRNPAAANGVLTLQGDGNLCINGPQATGLWCSGSNAPGRDFFLILRDTGELEIYLGTPDKTNAAVLLWTSLPDIGHYASRYPELQQAFGNDARKYMAHWVNRGRLEGRSARAGMDDAAYQRLKSANLDILFYTSRYPEVRQAFGYDADKIYQHWITYGIPQRRMPNKATEDLMRIPPRSAHLQTAMRVGDWLSTDEVLLSNNRQYYLKLVNNANLAVYIDRKAINPNDRTSEAQSQTWAQSSAISNLRSHAVLQADGRICTYTGAAPKERSNPTPISCIWEPAPVGPYFTVLQNNGFFYTMRGNGPDDVRSPTPLWDTTPKPSSRSYTGVSFIDKAVSAIEGAYNSVAHKTTALANTVADGTINTANTVANTSVGAANELARETVNAANTVARTAVDVANQTADVARNIVDLLKGDCESYAKYLPDPASDIARLVNSQSKNAIPQDVETCIRAYRIGYSCQIPAEIKALFEDAKFSAEFAKRVGEESLTRECAPSYALAAPPMFFAGAPLVCGALKIMVNDSIKLGRCTAAAISDGSIRNELAAAISDTLPGNDSNESKIQAICTFAGRKSLTITKELMLKKLDPGSPAKLLDKYLGRGGNAGMLSKKMEEKVPECRD